LPQHTNTHHTSHHEKKQYNQKNTRTVLWTFWWKNKSILILLRNLQKFWVKQNRKLKKYMILWFWWHKPYDEKDTWNNQMFHGVHLTNELMILSLWWMPFFITAIKCFIHLTSSSVGDVFCFLLLRLIFLEQHQNKMKNRKNKRQELYSGLLLNEHYTTLHNTSCCCSSIIFRFAKAKYNNYIITNVLGKQEQSDACNCNITFQLSCFPF